MSQSDRLAVAAAVGLTLALAGAGLLAQEPQPPLNVEAERAAAARVIAGPRSGGGNFRDFNEVTRGAEKIDGLFTLHKKDDHLYAEIRPDQLNQPLLVPVTIARGLAQAGMPVGDDDLVLVFRRVGDRIQVVRRNIYYKAPAGTPLEKSVKQNYTDSVLMALPIIAINPMRGGATLIDFSDIFMTDFAQLGLGSIDRSRSHWSKVKGFPNNLELELETTYAGAPRRLGAAGENGLADSRGMTLVLHYSIMKAPDPSYRPRAADDRVGHFLSATKDFGVNSPETNFVRYINRWRLEKSDPKAKLSPPKKQIVWYVEDTVPMEYRPFVEDGIREWNKAFERIGFRNAIAVRWQEAGRDDFDPEDTNYCTFRWVTSDAGFAMSCFRANPLTGEIIDGDVIFDASFIRHWKQSYALLVGNAAAESNQGPAAIALGEVISPILAAKMGYGQPATSRLLGTAALDRPLDLLVPELIPADQDVFQWQLARNLITGNRGFCQLQTGLRQDFSLAAIAFADPARAPSAETLAEGENPPAPKKPEPKDEFPEEFLGQAIKHIVMHEVGHSLGLRHNFKSSTMLPNDQLHNPEVTRTKGLVGSVMDYSPVNIAPKGKKQGDFYSTTIGPYDYWAIEYAYKPIDGDEAAELKRIAARAPEPELVYATDEDAFQNDDPYVNRFDLGSDPCQYGKERIELATELLKDLDSRVVKDGEAWARLRTAFGVLLNQWGDGATLASQFIGGQSVSRDHKADKDGRDPIVPVPGPKQRECLKFLSESILSDQAFQFSPTLLRRLGTERWSHWGSNRSASVDISVLERVLGIQKIVLNHCLSPRTLSRLQNQQLQADPGTDPLRIEEVFRALSDGIWSDLDKLASATEPAAAKLSLSTIRRNLQREHLRRLAGMVLGDRSDTYRDAYSYVVFVVGAPSAVPADARALARLHLKDLGTRIGKTLEAKGAAMDDTTRAHLEECHHRIAKILEANLDLREP